MMDDLKQIRISILRLLIITSLSLEYKENFKSLSWCTHHILNHLKYIINDKNMGLKLEKGLELFFKKKLKQTITHPLLLFCVLLLQKHL
jgi:hypothetical protein